MDNVENQTQDGQNLTAGAAGVSAAYPNGDPAVIERNNAEINAAIEKASRPKLVRHLLQQRLDEAQHEVERLTKIRDTAPAPLLDCTLADAETLFR